MRKIYALILMACLLISVFSSLAGLAKSSTTARIAWVYDTDFYTLEDELSYLRSLNPSKYSYDSYNQYNIESLWQNLESYKAILIDEDVMYDESWTRLDGPIYNSFKKHCQELAIWIYSGGGLFATDNNDLGASGGYSINELVWDWLPEDLQVCSSDVGDDASGGHLKIVDADFWLFNKPNRLDDRYINDPSRGHAHGYFIMEKCPGYIPLIIRTDTEYYGKPVEIYTTYGAGVVVLSHAELEDGFSWEYVQNEIDNVLLTPREQLLNALSLLNATICDAIIKATNLTAYMRAKCLDVIDPYNSKFFFDMLKIIVGLVLSKVWPPKVDEFDSAAVQRLYEALWFFGKVNVGLKGIYIAENVMAELSDSELESKLESIFEDKKAYHMDNLKEKIDLYYSKLMNEKKEFPCIGWQSSDGKIFYGINDVLLDVKNKYSETVKSIPETLPESFNLQFILEYLNDLRKNILLTTTKHNTFWFYNTTKYGGSVVELGSLNSILPALDEALGKYNFANKIDFLLWLGSIALRLVKFAASVPTSGASLLLNLLVGVGTGIAGAYCKRLSIYYKELVLQLLIQSLEALGTEIFLYRDIFQEALNFVNQHMKITEANTPNVHIMSFAIENAETDEDFGNGQGKIKVRNVGKVDANATLVIMFYAPSPKGYVGMQMIDVGTMKPNEERELTFQYTLPRNTILKCTEYLAKAFIISASTSHIYNILKYGQDQIFYVGKDCGCVGETILSGDITQGQTKTATYTSNEDYSKFILSYMGSDVDLHLYDSSGKHVGVDYNTRKIEIQIPGAVYSGPQVEPEWILVPNSRGRTYVIKVVGVDLLHGENYTVTAVKIPKLTTSVTTSPSKIFEKCKSGSSITTVLTLIEYSGVQNYLNITISSTSLYSQSGAEISKENIKFENNSLALKKWEAKTININVTVPSTVTPGIYSGNITINLSGYSQNGLVVPISVEVPDVTPPVAKILVSKTTVTVGEIITFNASQSYDNVGIVSYEWDFGDGKKAYGVTASHAFNSPGNYTVQLKVKDAYGNAGYSYVLIQVLPNPWWVEHQLWILTGAVATIAILTVISIKIRKRKKTEDEPTDKSQ